jgi:S1-C subfamily serine protease
MKFRTSTLFASVLALTMSSSAFAGDGEDFLRRLLQQAMNQQSNSGLHQGQTDHGHQPQHGQQFQHGQPFHQSQQFNPGPSPAVVPFVKPGISQPRLDINGHYVCGQGLLITRVNCGGLAERLGLERGDTIVAINGETIESRNHFHDLLRDAVVCHGGHAQLLVRNVRGFPLYVTVHAYFPSGNAPVLYNYHP